MSDIAFPYPVLGRGQDYVGAEFQSALKVPEGEVAAGQTLALPFELDLNDASIEAEIKSGRAAFGFEISCSGTSIRYIETVEKKGELLLDPKKFFRQVKISARIFVIEEIKGFSSPNLNPEFGQMKFDLEPGDFLAMAEDDSINVDYKYLRFEDALTVQKQSSLRPWEYVFGLDGEGIIIGMGSEFHNFWSHAKKKCGLQALPYNVHLQRLHGRRLGTYL